MFTHRSYGVVLWELMICETPYREVNSSAILWGVGSNSLHLPIPSSCPDGLRLLIKQCWAAKPRNRPSFKHIMMHLEIASSQVLAIAPDEYFKRQVTNNFIYINNVILQEIFVYVIFFMF